jgi:hypothetical protein
MVANFAAGTLVVLGVLIAVLGLFAGGSIVIASVGLAAIAVGGGISLLAERMNRSR